MKKEGDIWPFYLVWLLVTFVWGWVIRGGASAIGATTRGQAQLQKPTMLKMVVKRWKELEVLLSHQCQPPSLDTSC